MPRLAEHFQVYAVDLRGQGRSTRTPGRYTLDNMGNDLVRFIDAVIGRPDDRERSVSSGGVLAGLAVGVRQAGPDRRRLLRGSAAVRLARCNRRSVPASASRSVRCSTCGARTSATSGRSARGTRCAPRRPTVCRPWMAGFPIGDEPRQDLKEYDPEWGRAFWTGAVAASCDHERMLRSVKVPHVLLTHHFRVVAESTGALMGALSRRPGRSGAGAAPRGRRLGDVPRVPDRRSRRCTASSPTSTSTRSLEWVAALGS